MCGEGNPFVQFASCPVMALECDYILIEKGMFFSGHHKGSIGTHEHPDCGAQVVCMSRRGELSPSPLYTFSIVSIYFRTSKYYVCNLRESINWNKNTVIQETEVSKHRKHQTHHKKNPSLASKLGFPPVQSEKNQYSNIYVLLMSQIKITAASLEFFSSVRISEEEKKIKVGGFLEANWIPVTWKVNRIN